MNALTAEPSERQMVDGPGDLLTEAEPVEVSSMQEVSQPDPSGNCLVTLSRRLRSVGLHTLPLVHRAVLVALAGRANDDWIAWPKLATLAVDAGTTVNTVRRSLEWLIARGWVWVRRAGSPRESARLEVRQEGRLPESGVTQRYPRGHAPRPQGAPSQGSRSGTPGITERIARDHGAGSEDHIEGHSEDHIEDPNKNKAGKPAGRPRPGTPPLQTSLLGLESEGGAGQPKIAKPLPANSKAAATETEIKIFEAFLLGRKWRQVVKGAAPRLDSARLKAVRSKLAEGFPASDLEAAAMGIWLDPWHWDNGQCRFDLALKKAESIERFAALHHAKLDEQADKNRGEEEPEEENPFAVPGAESMRLTDEDRRDPRIAEFLATYAPREAANG